MPADLRELITLQQAWRLVDGLSWGVWAAAVLCLAMALVWSQQRLWWARTAASIAPAALLLAVGWQVYLARVSYNPATGFCGLHSVRIWIENAIAACIIGALYGIYLRWLWTPAPAPKGQPNNSQREGSENASEDLLRR